MSEENRSPESKEIRNKNTENSQQSWTNHPDLHQIDPGKLQQLMNMAEQAKGKSQADLLPFLMSMGNSGKVNFSSEEMESIIHVLKIGKSPKEVRKIQRMCDMLKQMKR